MSITLSRPFRSEREITSLIHMTYQDRDLPAFTIQGDLQTLVLDPQSNRQEVLALVYVLMHAGLLQLEGVRNVA